MMRDRLPNRRLADTRQLDHNGMRFAVTIGTYPDGRIGEVFTHGAKAGSAMDGLLNDACVLISRLLQHGATPADLARSMGRLGDARPASVIGAVVDLLASAEVGP